jgi:hypothetical protein
MNLDEYNSGDIVQLVCGNGRTVEGVLIKPDYCLSEEYAIYYVLNETSGSTPTYMLIESLNHKLSYNIITEFCDMYPRAFSFDLSLSDQLILISRYNNVSLLNITRQILNELI